MPKTSCPASPDPLDAKEAAWTGRGHLSENTGKIPKKRNASRSNSDRSRVVDEDCFPYTGNNNSICSIRRLGPLREAGCTPPQYSERTGRYKVGPAYRLGNETDIMYEILRSGPVQGRLDSGAVFWGLTQFLQPPSESTMTFSRTKRASIGILVPLCRTSKGTIR